MNNKIIFGFGLMMVLMMPQIQAMDYAYSCLNATHLFKEAAPLINGAEYEYNQTILCSYGCESNLTKYGADCVDPPYIITIEIIIGLVLIFGFLAFIARGRL